MGRYFLPLILLPIVTSLAQAGDPDLSCPKLFSSSPALLAPPDLAALVKKYNQPADPNGEFSRLRAEEDSNFGTIRIFYSEDRNPEDAEALGVFFHGMGSFGSGSNSFKVPLNLMGAPRAENAKGTLKAIQQDPHYHRLALEAIDLPGHGVGPTLDAFQSLDETVHWVAEYLMARKANYFQARGKSLPLIVISRSASPRFLTEVNTRYPGLIDGMFLISPELPGNDDLFSIQKANNLKVLAEGGMTANIPVIEWYMRLGKTISWTPLHFGDTETAIVTGGRDQAVLDAEKKQYFYLSRESKNIHFHEIAGAEHDLFSTQKDLKVSGQRAYELFYEFVDRVLRANRQR